jgi:hypothetical protein
VEQTTGQLIQHHPASRRVRREAGFARRKDVPLEDHAAMPDIETRRDPVDILTAQDEDRLQRLVPIRHGRMSGSPFTFYRGSAAVQAADLSNTPTTDLTAQLCGDAHLANFGLFNGPDRRLVFDLNDFDETHPGPFEWDVKRLAASVAVAGRNNELSPKKIDRAVRAAVAGYRQTVWACSQRGPLDVHYWRLELDTIKDLTQQEANKKAKKRFAKMNRKATAKDSVKALNKLTDVVDGRRVIVSDPPLIQRRTTTSARCGTGRDRSRSTSSTGSGLRQYADLCGRVLAISHARSGDASMIAGYLGEDETFDHAVAVFAHEYADLTELDHKAHVAAIASGRVEAIDDID